MIQEAYVSFEIATLLKEKGFDVSCFDFYEVEYEHPIKKHSQKYKPTDWNGEGYEDCFSAPTHQMTLARLRKKKVFVFIMSRVRITKDFLHLDALFTRKANIHFLLVM